MILYRYREKTSNNDVFLDACNRLNGFDILSFSYKQLLLGT